MQLLITDSVFAMVRVGVFVFFCKYRDKEKSMEPTCTAAWDR